MVAASATNNEVVLTLFMLRFLITTVVNIENSISLRRSCCGEFSTTIRPFQYISSSTKCCKMVQVGNSTLVIFAIVSVLAMKAVVEGSNSVGRRHFFALLSDDINDLARRDFESMVTLKQFREFQRQKGQELPFSKAVDT